MSRLNHFGTAGAVSAFVVLFSISDLAIVGSARADENRFAVTTLANRTSDVSIHFEYRWGDGEWKKIRNLKPGRAEILWHELDAQGKAPRLQMRINEAIGGAHRIEKIYDLKWHLAPDKDLKFAYPFSVKRDIQDNKYVSIYDDLLK